jgi:hypothetical protein
VTNTQVKCDRFSWQTNCNHKAYNNVNYLTLYFVPRVGGRTKRFYSEGGKEIVVLRFDEVEQQTFDPISENVVTEVDSALKSAI